MMSYETLNARKTFLEKSQEKITQLVIVANELCFQLYSLHPEEYAEYVTTDITHFTHFNKLFIRLNYDETLSDSLLYEKWEEEVKQHINTYKAFCITLYEKLGNTRQSIEPNNHAFLSFIEERYALKKIKEKYQNFIQQTDAIQLELKQKHPGLYPQGIIDSIHEEYEKLTSEKFTSENITHLSQEVLIAKIKNANTALRQNLNLAHDINIKIERAQKIIHLFIEIRNQFSTSLDSSKKNPEYLFIQTNMGTCASELYELKEQTYSKEIYDEIASIEQMIDKLSIRAAKYFLNFYKTTNQQFHKNASKLLEERNKTPMPATDEDIQKMTDHYQQLKKFLENCTDQTTLQDLQSGAKPLYCNFSIFCDTQEKIIKEQRESKHAMEVAAHKNFQLQRMYAIEKINFLPDAKQKELRSKLDSKKTSEEIGSYIVELSHYIKEKRTEAEKEATSKINNFIDLMPVLERDPNLKRLSDKFNTAKNLVTQSKSLKPMNDFICELNLEIENEKRTQQKSSTKSTFDSVMHFFGGGSSTTATTTRPTQTLTTKAPSLQ